MRFTTPVDSWEGQARVCWLAWIAWLLSWLASNSENATTTPPTGVGVHLRSASPWSRNCADDTMVGPMRLDPDFSEFIALLRAHEARFLIVGGYAVAFHGHPRYTGDLDVWLLVDDGNARAVLAALHEFGFGGVGLGVEDFTRPDHVVQLGYPPLRIDLLTSVDGVDFAEAYERRIEVDVAGTPVPFIALEDLRRNKEASARAQDLADLEALRDE